MSAPERTRVAITGMGVKSPAGNSVDEAYTTIMSAKSAATTVDELVAENAPVRFACMVPDFPMDGYVSLRERRQIDRGTQLALCAAADAVRDADLPTTLPAERVGVHLGTGIGGLTSMEATALNHGDDPAGIPVHTVPRTMANSAAARVAMRYGFQGSCTTYATACASGTTAIGEAARRIRYGELDAVVAGGFDSAITTIMVAGFARMRALSTRNDAPWSASRPFDAERDGFVLAEGAAMMVLERWDAAAARGARIYGEVAGYAANADAFNIVAPLADGAVAARCMALAIADAGLGPADIGHINAHGTSTRSNDSAEAAAISRCFGATAPPVTSVKGVTGHLIGGSGALEACVALVCAERGVVPPVANLADGDEFDFLDIVTGVPRAVPTAPALSNSFGFGGQNACLVLTPALWNS
ncbi:beta-ketoacyl-[acyl-carrier-protein] synthase family protein [Streptantibioticus rubrisoli]|uniref:Beta-ketoacyl-[acyl-carrier-protein] synthase family protein n=1 Tax=Streptantibioticus rubrisoli TaxID=1387313 RepID=A0ABT1PB48_9ACTN|nr:beta-ketoacyl-[acyl-carrier-protein] synthase family protein [Streptantibioticus rubrisoli]MCQ4042592.1 beta-ketoacyl-[acyl-carrier-protein] synthase family protein [Streptantibioticus rubrisoli]